MHALVVLALLLGGFSVGSAAGFEHIGDCEVRLDTTSVCLCVHAKENYQVHYFVITLEYVGESLPLQSGTVSFR